MSTLDGRLTCFLRCMRCVYEAARSSITSRNDRVVVASSRSRAMTTSPPASLPLPPRPGDVLVDASSSLSLSPAIAARFSVSDTWLRTNPDPVVSWEVNSGGAEGGGWGG